MSSPRSPRLTVVVPFRDEVRLLPRLLASIERQTLPPDVLVLADDGSTDGSGATATAFANRHDWVSVVHRPRRAPEPDRLATAEELRSFQWACAQLAAPWDVLAKLDADLELNPRHFECMVRELERDPRLGIVGARLSDVRADGSRVRTSAPRWHVRGATKFYRRECYEQIQPIPAHLGWDMIDSVKARALGWRTESIELPGGDTLHLRPTGARDGRRRAFRRWGECAWGYGSHPLFVLLGAAKRSAWRPYLVGGFLYAAGYTSAWLRSAPRAEPSVRAAVRREERSAVIGSLVAPLRPRRALAASRR